MVRKSNYWLHNAFKNQFFFSDDESGSSRGSSSGDMGSTNREEDVNHEYQTMDRITYEPPATSSTFRPPNQSTTSNNSSSTPRSSSINRWVKS